MTTKKTSPPQQQQLDLDLAPITSLSANGLGSFQLYGHVRSPSMDFKEQSHKEAQSNLALELDKLRRAGNLPDAQTRLIDKEFDGYRQLFGKFLNSKAREGVIWDKIEKLPGDAVSTYLAVVA